MGTITKIALDQNTNKTCVAYVKFDESQAGVKAIVLARITVRPRK